MRQLDGIPNSMDRNLNELWEILKDRKAWHAGVHGVSKSQNWLSDLTTSKSTGILIHTRAGKHFL